VPIVRRERPEAECIRITQDLANFALIRQMGRGVVEHPPEPWIWTGYGVSGAVARAAAAQSRTSGRTSWTEPPSELTPGAGTIILISQSGASPIECEPDLLVTQESGRGPRLLTPTSPTAWVPLEFAERAVTALLQWMGGRAAQREEYELPPPTSSDVLVLQRYTEAGKALLDAASAKLGYQPFALCDASELGHGLHFGLLDSGRVLLLGCQNPWRQRIREWSDAAGVEVLEAPTRQRNPTEAFLVVCEALRSWAGAEGVDLKAVPIASEHDGLRHPAVSAEDHPAQ